MYEMFFASVPGGNYFFFFVGMFAAFLSMNLMINISYYLQIGISRVGDFSYLPVGCKTRLTFCWLVFKMGFVVYIFALSVVSVPSLILPAVSSAGSIGSALYNVIMSGGIAIIWVITASLYVWALRLEYWSLNQGKRIDALSSKASRNQSDDSDDNSSTRMDAAEGLFKDPI